MRHAPTHTLRELMALLILCSMWTGCATAEVLFMGAGKQIDIAVEKRDRDTLANACDKGRLANARLQRKDRRRACAALSQLVLEEVEHAPRAAMGPACLTSKLGEQRLRSQARDVACARHVVALEAETETRPCEDLTNAWEETKALHRARAKTSGVYKALGARAAACESWAFLFGTLSHTTSSKHDANKLYTDLSSNHDLQKAYLSYVTPQTKRRSIQRFTYWLSKIASDPKINCNAWYKLTSIQGAKQNTLQFHALRTLRASSSCDTRALALAKTMTRSQDPSNRLYACAALGQIGSKKHIKTVRTLGFYDKDYKVRRECLNAVSQLKLK